MELKVLVMGAGVMGRLTAEEAELRRGVALLGNVEPMKGERLEDMPTADVLIDFSHPDNLPLICDYARERGCAVVIATTGYGREEMTMISELSESVPVVMSANFSVGIALVRRTLRELTTLLGEDFDIEIIEKHHRRKSDAPSGTALALAAAVDPNREHEWIYGRRGVGRRDREIAIHAVRGGTIAGEHTVMFAGEDEVIELRHTAASRRIFAVGALRAAAFVHSMPPALYTADDIYEIHN